VALATFKPLSNGRHSFSALVNQMKVAKALQWLIDNEPEGLRVKWLGQTVYFNGENVEIERKSCAPMVYTPVDFLRIYARERFSHRWSQLNYFQQNVEASN